MNYDLLTTFSEKPARETSGSRSANRFDYQKNWSFCELLSLHLGGEDYLMIFEHHEDVVVFDSQTNPTSAIFYQVKSKNKSNWTIGSLTKSKGSNLSASIIGKLYSNYLQFLDKINKLVFTSNQGLSAKLENGERSIDCETITFSQLSSNEKEKVQKAVEGPDQNYCDFFGLSKLIIHKTDLRIDDHTAITKGKLVEFFERLHPERPVHVAVVYKTIFDEIRRKTNYEGDWRNKLELCARKGISRSDFEKIVSIVLQYRTPDDLWSDALPLLTSEGYGVLEIRRLKSGWQQYAIERMNATNEPLMQIRSAICSNIEEIDKTNLNIGLKSISNTILTKLNSNIEIEHYSDHYIESAILYEVINNDPVSQINEKSTDKTT